MKIYTKIMILISVLSLMSCDNWLDLKPEGQATQNDIFSSAEGYRSVLNGLYKSMGKKELYGFELQFGMLDCMSQQYIKDRMSTSNMSAYIAAANFDYNSTDLNPTIEKLWESAYNIIANANNLIQHIKNASPDLFALGEPELNMILGEAYACRALMHFDLLRLFAPAPINDDGKAYVPYVESYPDIQAARIPVNQFLEKVIKDLQSARSLEQAFDTTALGQSVSASGKSRFYNELEYGMEGAASPKTIDDFYKGRGYRLSYYGVTALLARVYQYAGNRQEAFEAAREVLEAKAKGVGVEYEMYALDDYNGIQWQENENQTNLKVVSNLIFAIYNEKAYTALDLARYFAKKTEGMNTNNWFQLDLEGQKIFYHPREENKDESFRDPNNPWNPSDVRGTDMIFKADNYYPVSAKWYCSDNTEIRDKNVTILPVIRATEMRYIMAEEYARQGNFTEAYNILNLIRSNRGLQEELTAATNYAAFQKDLIRDAQREWIAEGQLFYLYKRLNAPIRFSETENRPLSRSEYLLPTPSNQNL